METDWNQRYIDESTPWDSGEPSKELTRALDQKLIEPCRVLELGCGTGTNAIFLARAGFSVTAVDLSEEALRQARSKAEAAGVDIEFIQADVTALPDLGEAFPFVFDRGTYHVVRELNLAGFIETISKVVAPGGIYLVMTGNANERVHKEDGPPKVRAHELCRELEGESFDLLRMEETVFHKVQIDGRVFEPLAWVAVFRRRESPRI